MEFVTNPPLAERIVALEESSTLGMTKKARELAAQPLEIRGYGFIKDAAIDKAAPRRDELLAAFRAGGWPDAPNMAIAAE